MTKIVINDCYGGFGISGKAKAFIILKKELNILMNMNMII